MPSSDRMGLVDFPAPFMSSYEVLVDRDNTFESAGACFLTAFSNLVWACIATPFVIFTFIKLLDRRFAPPDPSFTPLPSTVSRSGRLKHFLLKSRILFRLRSAVQDTCTFLGQEIFQLCNSPNFGTLPKSYRDHLTC